jgi:hypothetical protein
LHIVNHLWIFSGEMSVQAFCPFFQLGCFLLLSLRNSLHTLDNSPFLNRWLANIFSHPMGCFFTLLTVSPDAQKLLILYFYFVAFYFLLVLQPRNYCQMQCHKATLPCFLLRLYSTTYCVWALNGTSEIGSVIRN